MGKPYLKQVVKWRKNEAPEGLMQICVGTYMGQVFGMRWDTEQQELTVLTYQHILNKYWSYSLSK